MYSLMKIALALAATVLFAPAASYADEPLSERGSWDGNIDFVMTGVGLAADTNANFRVDTLVVPANFQVTSADVSGTLEAAWLYWGGSQVQPAVGCTGTTDEEVSLTLPNASTLTVTKDVCYCSDGGANSYDVWVCRADITQAFEASGSGMVGMYTVDDYAGLIADGSTHNASASLFLVYKDPALNPRRVTVWDGNVDLVNDVQTVTLDNVDVDSIPSGNLTFYVLEGDIGGAGTEEVSVTSLPGNGSLVLSDGINPADNPFNRTINTTNPTQTDVIGVDIDKFDITSALTARDTSIEVTNSAGDDKVWVIANVLAVDLFDPILGANSSKSASLENDADNDGQPTFGDTIRFVITLVNDGNEAATVDVTDEIPTGVSAYTIVDAAGATDASNATTIQLNGVTVAAGSTTSITIDMDIADVADMTIIQNVASWSAPSQGGRDGAVTSPEVIVRRDGDADTVYDSDDNCPDTANTNQADADNDGVGDACDTPPDMGMADMGASDMGSDAGSGMDAGQTDTGSADFGGPFDDFGAPDFGTADMGGDTGSAGGDTGGTVADSGSTGNGGGDAGVPPGGDKDFRSDGGCCSSVDGGSEPVTFWFALLALAVGLLRLRRD